MVYGTGGEFQKDRMLRWWIGQDKAGSYQKVLELQSPVNRDGSYSFTGVEVALNRAFLIITSYGGVEYQSDPVM